MVGPGVLVRPVGQLGQDPSPRWPGPGQPCLALSVHPSWAGKALGGPRPIHPAHSARRGPAWPRTAHLLPNGRPLRAQRPSLAQPGPVRLARARGCGRSLAWGQLPAASPSWVMASPLPVRSAWSLTLSLGPCPSPGPPMLLAPRLLQAGFGQSLTPLRLIQGGGS